MRSRTTSLRALSGAVGAMLFITSCSSSSPKPRTTSSRGTQIPAIGAFSTHTLKSGGLDRKYGLFIPTEVTAPAPAIVVLHALDLNPADAGASARFGASAITNGYVLVTPVGIDASWNAGTCCLPATSKGIDDVQFVSNVIDSLVDQQTVDTRRVYVAGFSNGAMLAYRIGCELSQSVAGVAVVAGVLTVDTCTPTAPVDLISLHQMGDPAVPFAGTETSNLSADGRLPGVAESFDRWAKGFRCNANGLADLDGRTSRRSYICADRAKAEVVTISGGDHSWPVAKTSIDSVAAIVEFFSLNVATT